MGDVLMVPEGYEKYKKAFLKKLARGEVKDFEELKEEELFYIS